MQLLEIAGKLCLAIGVALLVGATLDLVRARIKPPADPQDFSLEAMRDRRSRKQNGYFFRHASGYLTAGVVLLGVTRLF